MIPIPSIHPLLFPHSFPVNSQSSLSGPLPHPALPPPTPCSLPGYFYTMMKSPEKILSLYKAFFLIVGAAHVYLPMFTPRDLNHVSHPHSAPLLQNPAISVVRAFFEISRSCLNHLCTPFLPGPSPSSHLRFPRCRCIAPPPALVPRK